MEKLVSAVIVAAGKGTRMGLDKVFYKLKGKETLLYSLEAFQKNEGIREIVLVVAKENLERAREITKNKFSKLTFIAEGGDTRSKSVSLGIEKTTCPYIAIHDGARPLVSQKIITDCIKALDKYDGVTVSLPVTDTIKRFKGDFIEETVNREEMVSVQTPQCFKKEIYLECLDRLKDESFTDDCLLFEKCGHPVYLVRGEERNIKLTRKSDIILAEAFLGEGLN